ncbi:HGGxSTG domain-containing protein [Pseudooceanicola nitratireducens]|uniref:HGGxSTG domain-containing protein n=1 Tax=Pseudooceanicola nitratireducens TaxID=517719 RepID=UPI0028F43698|nr:HGGxSTG domain-containing protein [Pseudooceanicola nitratireducens]
MLSNMDLHSATIEEITECLEKLTARADAHFGLGCAFRICPYHRHMNQKTVRSCAPCKHRSCSKLRAVGLDDEGKALPPKERPRCTAKTRTGSACKHPVSPGKRRCRLHGGASTGPRTEAGKRRIAEGQKKRREREKRLGSESARPTE